MAKRVTRPIQYRDKDGNRQYLQPGDTLPTGVEVDRQYIEEYADEFLDHTQVELRRAAERLGVKVDPAWDKVELAQAVRGALWAAEHPDAREAASMPERRAASSGNRKGSTSGGADT